MVVTSDRSVSPLTEPNLHGELLPLHVCFLLKKREGL
jgi:hypothetical protein